MWGPELFLGPPVTPEVCTEVWKLSDQVHGCGNVYPAFHSQRRSRSVLASRTAILFGPSARRSGCADVGHLQAWALSLGVGAMGAAIM